MPKEAKERLQERLCKKKAEEEERQKTDEAKRRAAEFKAQRGEVDDNTLKSIFLSVILFKNNNKNENYQIALGCFIHALSLISESNEGGEGIFPNRVKDQIKFISSLEGKTLEQGNNKFQLPQNILEILDTVIDDIKIKNEGLGSNLELLMSEKDQKETKHVDAKKIRRRRRVKASDATTDDPKPKPLSELPDEALDELKDIIWGIENTFIEAFQITPSDESGHPSGKLGYPPISRSRSLPQLSK